jgi:nitroreductase
LIADRTIEFFDNTCHQLTDPKATGLLAAKLGAADFRRINDARTKYEGLVAQYRQGEPVILRNAPGLLLAHAETIDDFGRDHCLFATYNFMLGATARGLGTCPMGFVLRAFRYDPAMGEIIDLPSDHMVYGACIFGYPSYRHQRLVPRNPIPTRWF